LSAAKGKYLGAEAQFSYSQIRSPIDGVIADRPQYPRELATANQLQPLAITVIGGLLNSLILSLVFTPIIHFYLHRA
jgi:hypothetical protein